MIDWAVGICHGWKLAAASGPPAESVVDVFYLTGVVCFSEVEFEFFFLVGCVLSFLV